jgi:hydroxymethylglutaryl-CoA reductase (NADPH)
MATSSKEQKRILQTLLDKGISADLSELQPCTPQESSLPSRLPGKGTDHTIEAMNARRSHLAEQGFILENLYTECPDFEPASLQGNIENFIGYAQTPIGIIGPLRIRGLHAKGDFFIPLSTSEGALVASFNRGAHAISQSGGAIAVCTTESVSRAPVFQFKNLSESCLFSYWALSELDTFKTIVSDASRYCKLQELRTKIIGKEVYLIFEYTTGDASGQNMVTLATDKICKHIISHYENKPQNWHIDGNLSGDKKATMLSFGYARGKKVIVEVTIPRKLSQEILHVTPEEIHNYWQISFIGGTLSGSIGSQGHFANGLAALFLSCGQDIACVSEAAVGITRIDVTEDKDLYISVMLPNLIVGTVGGGTSLPTAKSCLQMLDCYGENKAQKFAEICASTVLAGELSMIAALTHGDFSSAHEKLGRKNKKL